MAKTLTIEIQKRFNDIDSFRHVNNVAQQTYFDLGKTDYYRRVMGIDGTFGKLRVITVSTHTDFRSQVRMTDDVTVSTTVSRLGTKSMTIYQQLLCGGECRTESTSVMVAFDYENQCSVEIPDEWREKLQ
ncbi:MAG: thioesterase family protein [Alistipes sp.]|jgi:acyl-CoA thioester hydrolase|nr:thioesterase family protein [Alistipes sp.]